MILYSTETDEKKLSQRAGTGVRDKAHTKEK
jgi:hypothetical protein